MRLLVLFIWLFLSACASVYSNHSIEEMQAWPAPPILKDLHTYQPGHPSQTSEIYKLTEKQKQAFLTSFNSQAYRHLLPNKRIAFYLQGELENFNFYSDTLTASQAISRQQGNCLSLANVTKALADLVNVEVRYELVATPPIYQKNGDLVFISQHVRTFLMDPKPGEIPGYNPMWRSFIRVDYFPSNGSHRLREVKQPEFYSMYYNNKAAEALSHNNDALAFWYLLESLKVNKADPQTINILALIHQRAGYKANAEQLYRYGLKYSGDNFELLSNYYHLLFNSNRNQQAEKIALKLRKYNDPNPYKWIDLGNKEYQAKNFSSAIYYYKKANKMANYLHEGYAGIARAQYSLGNLSSAQRSIKKAIKNSNDQAIAAIYQAEYRLFTQQ